MSEISNIPFSKVIEALLDEQHPFPPRYLHRLSDLEEADGETLKTAWPKLPAWRRQALMEDLEQLGSSDTVLAFDYVGHLALADETPKARLCAVRLLAEYEDEHLMPTFIQMMLQDADTEVRAAAATALGSFVYLGEIEELPREMLRRVEDALIQATKGKDNSLVRRRALESLGFSGRDEVPDLIQQAYASGIKDWLVSALFAMGRSADEEWAPQILGMLDNPAPTVRAEAASAAGELGLAKAVPTLLKMLDDDDSDVHDAAVWSLSQIGGTEARERLEKLLEDCQDEEEAEFLEEALDNLSFTDDFQLFSGFEISDMEEDGEEDDEWLDADDVEDGEDEDASA